MVDRQDIDALLIGSLYGELSSADEARLQAHLESYPADRTALDRLTHARDAVRQSRILEVQLDPPQSVSAMLLQEAARRAPRTVEAGEGWFARLRRSFLMHPAMAAATMLVVVVGIAGTLYLRKGDHFASPEMSVADRSAPAASGSAAPAPAPAAAMAPEAPVVAARIEPAQGPKPDPASKQANEKSSYRVGLVEGSARPDKEFQAKPDEAKAEQQADAAETVAATPTAKGAKKSADVDQRSGPGPVLEVRTPRLTPKDLDEATDGRVTQAVPQAPAPPSGANRGFAPPADPRPAVKQDTSPTPRPPEAAAPNTIATDAVGDAEEAAKLRRAPISGTAGGGGFAVAPTGGEDKGGAPEGDVSWAKGQHSRLVTQVRAGRCDDAASTALALSNRAPGYYQQNVETDRNLKACLPRINNARELEAERSQRARATSKRALEEPAKAAPAKAEPAKAKPAAASQRK